MIPAEQGGCAAELDAVWRRDAPRMRAVLTRRLNDLDLAEDALAEAVTLAAQR